MTALLEVELAVKQAVDISVIWDAWTLTDVIEMTSVRQWRHNPGTETSQESTHSD